MLISLEGLLLVLLPALGGILAQLNQKQKLIELNFSKMVPFNYKHDDIK